MTTPNPVRRINVAVNPETVEALRVLCDREHVTLTEATRRLVGYGAALYTAAKVDGAEILIRTAESTKELRVL